MTDLELETLMPTQNITMVMMKALLLETIEIGKGKIIVYLPILVRMVLQRSILNKNHFIFNKTSDGYPVRMKLLTVLRQLLIF